MAGLKRYCGVSGAFSVFSLMLVICSLLFTACPSPGGGAGGGEAGTITINLGSGARAAGGWQDGFANSIAPILEHTVTLAGSGGTQSKNLKPGETSASFKAAAGRWTVTVESFYGTYKVGTGTSAVDVKAGQSNPCSVSMEQAAPNAVYFLASDAATWKTAVESIASGGSYVIFVTAPFNVSGTFMGNGAAPTFNVGGSLRVTVCGSHKLTMTGTQNSIFYIASSDQTVILRDIKLEGNKDNACSIVTLESGTFIMQGSSSVSGNTASFAGNGGGVSVLYNGTFTMQDTASVYGNTTSGVTGGPAKNGGGVYVDNGTFTMKDKTSVYGNKAGFGHGGGVYITGANSTLNMQDNASMYNNTANGDGGGVYVINGTFTMSGSASVSGNTASNGGGVGIESSFNMSGSASVSGNTASDRGGGVNVDGHGTFNMNGGTISVNKAQEYGGGVNVYDGTFRIENGTVAGNTVIVGIGAALHVETNLPGTAEYGNGKEWTAIPLDNNNTREDDIIVKNGVLQ